MIFGQFFDGFWAPESCCKMFIFGLCEFWPYGANQGLKFSARSQSGALILSYFGLFWCPWAPQMEPKSFQNQLKILSFFGSIFRCDFFPKWYSKRFPKPSKVHQKSIQDRIWSEKRDFLGNSSIILANPSES